jgi:hypothetical protein
MSLAVAVTAVTASAAASAPPAAAVAVAIEMGPMLARLALTGMRRLVSADLGLVARLAGVAGVVVLMRGRMLGAGFGAERAALAAFAAASAPSPSPPSVAAIA